MSINSEKPPEGVSVYSETLPEDVMASARRAFDRHDHDNSGTIPSQVEEILQALVEARRDASEPKVTKILEDMGLDDGSSRVRFHEFLVLIEQTSPLAATANEGQEETDAIKNSFQWLGGDPEDAESKVTKDKLQQVLRDFELNDDVDQVLGTPDRKSVNDLTLQDLTEVLTHQG